MRLALWITTVLAVAAWSPAQEFSGPPQAKKGHDLFFAGTGGGTVACGSCHAIKKEGTAIGPDLTRLARLNPRAIVMAINATRTQYVQEVKPKEGDKFPGMKTAETAEGYEIYDLSKNPPELKKIPKADVSMSDNSAWKHPAEALKLSPEQLADIISFIKYAGYGDKNGVKVEDVE